MAAAGLATHPPREELGILGLLTRDIHRVQVPQNFRHDVFAFPNKVVVLAASQLHQRFLQIR